MQVIVLGSAAGGGVPQWNCSCAICAMARAGDGRVVPRTQFGLAISADGRDWLLVNSSPDLGRQIAATEALSPRVGSRDSPIRAVLLTGAEIDAVAGLLTLREGQPFALHATASTLRALAANPIFEALADGVVARRELALDRPSEVLPGLAVTAFAVPGKVPLWQEDAKAADDAGDAIGVMVEANGRRLAVVPGCARITDALLSRVAGADALLFDGTVFHDDDLARAGVGTKTGRRMGHVPMTGPDGSLAGLARAEVGRRIYIHLNNTNPVLVEGSPERREVERAGWAVAHDGMAFAP